jgi:meiotically up-regulated gene 157 (Mug157) protein
MSQRPQIEKRKFVSKAVEKTIQKVLQVIADKELAVIFENTFPNTLDTTIFFSNKGNQPDTFVITGDINAMWHRDSSAQVWPYLSFANEDEELKNMLLGVINRQVENIFLDPYANAFTDGSALSEWHNDLTEMKPGIHERKWELDSLCYHIRLSYGFWKSSDDTSCFTQNWKYSAESILNTFKEQQRKENKGKYKYGRITSWSTDTVPGNGYGNPINPIGLIASIFRPSDDATIFPFHIPSNFLAVISLRQMAEIFRIFFSDLNFSKQCLQLADEIENTINKFAITEHLNFGKIYAYEVDGFGNKLFMDDANIPSLLSLPYSGCCPLNNSVYKNTRRFILSHSNPYFFSGSAAEGIGSPHTLTNKIWPLSIIMRALTSDNDSEILECLKFLKTTHANTGFMHESFNKDNSEDFTRSWFAWANSLFGELILKLYNERRYILLKTL